MLTEDAQEQLVTWIVAIGDQLGFQPQHQLTHGLDFGRRLIGCHPVAESPGFPLHIGRKQVMQPFLVDRVQHAPDPMQDFHQQLQAAHVANVAGDEGRIHPLLMGLQLIGGQLLVGHLYKDALKQILARLCMWALSRCRKL